MSREIDHFALHPLASHHINFRKISPHLCSFPFYRALHIEGKKEKMKRKQGANHYCAHLWGEFGTAVFSLKPFWTAAQKIRGRKAGNFSELANVLFNFLDFYLVSHPFLLLVLAGSHDSFSIRERRLLDGRGGRDGAARHLVFLSRFTRSCFCRLDTRIAYTVNIFRFLYSNDHLKNSSSCVHSSLCCVTSLISFFSPSAV